MRLPPPLGLLDVSVDGTAADGVVACWVLDNPGRRRIGLVVDTLPADVLAELDGWVREAASEHERRLFDDARERGYTGRW